MTKGVTQRDVSCNHILQPVLIPGPILHAPKLGLLIYLKPRLMNLVAPQAISKEGRIHAIVAYLKLNLISHQLMKAQVLVCQVNPLRNHGINIIRGKRNAFTELSLPILFFPNTGLTTFAVCNMQNPPNRKGFTCW